MPSPSLSLALALQPKPEPKAQPKPNPDPDPDPHQLNWTLIPEELATANLSRVGPSTVAFHAVGMAAS